VVERRWIGGSCPNTACRARTRSGGAKVASLTRHAAQFGLETGPVALDMRRVLARKREMVDGLVAMHLDLFNSSGVELIMGNARLTKPRTVEVALNDGGTEVLTADRLFLNLGTHATIPGVPVLMRAKPLTNIEALELDRLPNHLIVLGGGRQIRGTAS
jgi:pyruvate/2-oxoglutarate dehydrogenase complex dihydrolipoamide dehydrogenase (E3) component